MNTEMKNNRRWIMLLACIALAGLLVVPVQAESTISKTDGAVLRIKAARWIEAQNAFSVVMLDGSTFMLQKGLVDKIEMDKPQKFALAESQLRNQQYDAAIMSLEGVIAEYQKLGWDMDAASRVADVYLRIKKDPKKASIALEKVIRGLPKSEISAETQLMYWSSLLAQGTGSAGTLKKELDEAIASGQRDLVAAAYVARGTLNHVNGQREAAVLDYLRVIVLFENVKGVQPEALYRAAQVLDELKDRGSRGDLLRKKLIDQYPDSPFADDAKRKMS